MSACENQKTTCRSQFSPVNHVCGFPQLNSGCRIGNKCFYLLSPLLAHVKNSLCLKIWVGICIVRILSLNYYFMCVDVLLAGMSVPFVCLVFKGARKGHWLLKLELQTVISCCGFWVLNLGPVQEQPVFLIPEPSLQLRILIFSMGVKN